MKRIILYICISLISLTVFSQRNVKSQFPHNVNQDSLSEYSIRPLAIPNLELPYSITPKEIIYHTGYSFLFSDQHKQSFWVAYQLTSKETEKNFERGNRFLPDPKVKNGTANDSDYKASGYDRGHLAPAADMGWSEQSMKESFYYSNMSPQKPGFNRGIWKQLEELIRDWAVENEEIYIVTGGVLKDNLPSIGNNKVSIPNYFYKVILDYKEPSIKGIGFIMPNEASNEPLQKYAVSIDSVERFTGINFFYLLPDEQEKAIESTLSLKSWNWDTSFSSNMGVRPIRHDQRVSQQCIGLTKKGIRCKNRTINTNGYCYLHQNQIQSVQNICK